MAQNTGSGMAPNVTSRARGAQHIWLGVLQTHPEDSSGSDGFAHENARAQRHAGTCSKATRREANINQGFQLSGEEEISNDFFK